jgi:hypothetical protein
MAFQIVEILESTPGKILARVNHENNPLTVTIPDQKVENILVGKSYLAEIGYEGIPDWKIIDDFDDAQSGIWQEENGVHLLGRVHNIIDFGDGRTIIDVYLQNGPEFFTLDTAMLGDETFESDTGLEITVSNLYLYLLDK